MKVKVTDDGLFLQIIEATDLEINQLKISFTKKHDKWFMLRKKKPNWDGNIAFINQYLQMPFGLWKELLTMCKTYGFQITLETPIEFYDKNFNTDDFMDWMYEYFHTDESKIKPRDYQYDAALKAFK